MTNAVTSAASAAPTGYPPEPWQMVGQLNTQVFLLDPTLLPAPTSGYPPGWRMLRIAGRCVAATAWVSYEAGSALEYRELMAMVLVRRGWRVMPSIIRIWVDSEASRDGGRSLWGIPKELAVFSFESRRREAVAAEELIARGRVVPRWRLPGRWPVRFSVVQLRGGATIVTPVRARARIIIDAAELHAPASGQLGFLAGRDPVLSLSLNDFDMIFGPS